MRIFSKLFVYAIVALPLAAQNNVPAQYQAIYTTVTTQISAFQTILNSSWNGNPYPVKWAPHLSAAESDNYVSLLAANYFKNAVSTELLEIQASGAKAVTVHISFPILYQPFYTYSGTPSNYQAFVSFYQQVATAVHAAGMKLIVETTVAEALDGTDGSEFMPYYETLTWDAYMSGRAQNAVNVATLIQPDYLSLICEPDTEAANANQPTENSPTGAMQLLQTDLTALQAVNIGNVQLGAGAGTWIANFTTYLSDFATTPLNYIDMHVYPVNNSELEDVLTGAGVIQQAGKAIGVSEAWADKIANSEVGTLNINTIDSRDAFSFWGPVDVAFLQAMVDCAQYQQFLFFAPSYPEYFAAYLNYNTYGADTPAQILPAAFDAASAAYRAGTFTSTGTAFSKMIVGVDTTPPTTPAAPTVVNSSSTGVTITWALSTDTIGVAGYNVYRNGALAIQLEGPTFYDSGLTPGATYTYTLSAFDAQGNVSGLSAPLVVTLIDLSPPSVPANLGVTGDTTSSVSLAWSPSTGGGGVGGYRVLKGTTSSNMSIVAGFVTTTSYTDPYAKKNTTYYYSVESYNLLGISSAPCSPVSVTTP